jgi:hypothetical protein
MAKTISDGFLSDFFPSLIQQSEGMNKLKLVVVVRIQTFNTVFKQFITIFIFQALDNTLIKRLNTGYKKRRKNKQCLDDVIFIKNEADTDVIWKFFPSPSFEHFNVKIFQMTSMSVSSI